MKINVLIVTVFLVLSQTSIAENKLIPTTDVAISIEKNTHDSVQSSSLSLIDNQPANLVFYDKLGKPDSRMQITSSKFKSGKDQVIKLSIQLLEFKNGKWSLSHKTSMLTHENKMGEIRISSQAQEWKLSAISKSGPSYKKNSKKIRNLKECNFNSLNTDSIEQSFWDGPGGPGEDPEDCCSAQCQDGSERTMKCCGAIQCCGCNACCSP